MSLSIAVAEATRFLIKPLQASYPQAALSKLEIALETNLTAHYSPSWVPNEPVRGSGRRCMTLSSACLPPRPIWEACGQCNVQWFEWMALFRYDQFDLFVDPGCVAIRFQNKIFNIWKAAPVAAPRKTFAQQVLAEDKEVDEIFDRLRDAIAAPSWTTPIVTQFPVTPDRSSSPLSSISEQSRCSSRSSNSSSSTFSFASADTGSSRSSLGSSKNSNNETKQSRRERSRQARVFVDTTKTEVTPYDGGKTTVLTGGVMLGGGPKTAAKPKAVINAASANVVGWRPARA